MKLVADPSGDLLAVPADEKVPAPAVSAESTLNMGTELVTVSEDVLNQSTKEDASEEVKKAFEDYLYSQPKLLKEGIKLKNYQMLGVNWLNMLYRKNISCILADEMGMWPCCC
jgi:SWI/SNF-related matrix-associated actin-dependent regulator 1 of chromatin subfamily A